ncbi:hypothetical protein [Ralstonia pickettii]|uniref:hypothetical protein n=1 Tax=Ralstonia pickettii TaxID=329 RepID=UPI00117FB2D6|nr:hypothetical protein [Ralstonia pickettii]
MKKIVAIRSIIGAMAAIASASAFCGASTGKVNYIAVRSDITYFSLSATNQSRPVCASQTDYYMIKDRGTSVGKQQVALLLTAKATDRAVSVFGANQCTVWSDGEDADSVMLH